MRELLHLPDGVNKLQEQLLALYFLTSKVWSFPFLQHAKLCDCRFQLVCTLKGLVRFPLVTWLAFLP